MINIRGNMNLRKSTHKRSLIDLCLIFCFCFVLVQIYYTFTGLSSVYALELEVVGQEEVQPAVSPEEVTAVEAPLSLQAETPAPTMDLLAEGDEEGDPEDGEEGDLLGEEEADGTGLPVTGSNNLLKKFLLNLIVALAGYYILISLLRRTPAKKYISLK